MPEQRQYKREEVEFVLKFRIKDSNENFKYAYYENISLGGVKIVDLSTPVERGTIIEIELSLPYTPNSALSNSLLIEGTTAHCGKGLETNKFNCGVQFTGISKDKTEKLNMFLQYANGAQKLKEED